jgi:hypothetical protein
METAGILTLLAALVILAALVSLNRRRRRRTFTQTLPVFTDSMPLSRQAEAERIARIAGDAQLILYYQYRGATGSRRAMAKIGLPERRWQAAVRLLRTLHIYERTQTTPAMAEYRALRRIAKWQRIQTARLGVSPAYVSSH